ncbi:universal stress protein [Prosthecobacter sp.]|uniref:universal stress protein n=1 Tax=Prosthecobacter sp. TaxID=1965333 RepID=UPI0037838829
MKTIVALVDFSDAASKVLNYTQMLAAAMGSRVVLLHVTPLEIPVATYGAEVPPIPVEPSLETLRAHEERLEELLMGLKKAGVNATAHQAKGPLAETVVNEAEALQADLIVMGTHHHSALYHFFIGTMTADVLKAATMPVLVVPCDGDAARV